MKHPPYMVGLGTMPPVAETFPDGPAARPSTGEGRGRLEPVGGEFGSLHEDRPDRLQGAGDRAARGERRWLGGRPGGGRLARRPGGRGGLGRGRQHGALLARRRDRPGAGGGRAGLHEHPRVRRAGGLVRPRGGLSPGRRVGRPAGRPRAGRRVPRGHADPLRGPARVLDQPARARGANRGLVLPPRDRRQGRRRGRKGGPGPTPPASRMSPRGRRSNEAVADLEGRPGRVQRVAHPGRGDRGVAAGSQRGRPRRGARLSR